MAFIDRLRFMTAGSPLDPETLSYEVGLVERALAFARAVCHTRLQTQMMYECSMPGKLSALLVRHPTELLKVLAEFRMWFDILTDAEREAHNNKYVANLLADLQWPRHHWIRQIFVALWEVDFQRVPDDAYREVELWSQCFKNSKACEDGFNICRDKEGLSKSGRLCPQSVWQHTRVSSIASDADRPPPTVTASNKQDVLALGTAKAFPREAFVGDAGQFSLGEEAKASLTKDTDWVSHSAPGFAMLGMLWSSMLKIGGDYRLLPKVWLSLVLTPGSVVKRVSAPELFYVLATSQHGAFVWKVHHASAGGALILRFSHSGEGRLWEHLLVTDYSQWQAVEVEALPPHQSGRAHEQLRARR